MLDLSTMQMYALKKISKGKMDDSEFNKIVRGELNSFLHLILNYEPELLQCYQFHYDPSNSCSIVMEKGIGTLQDFLRFVAQKGICIKDFYNILSSQLHYQLEKLHSMNTCHRDLKPENIMPDNYISWVLIIFLNF